MKADVTVVGSGPAGLAAALHAHENGAKDVLLLEREEELGGILKQCIHNGFGLEQFKKDYTGPEYAERLIEEVEKTDVRCFLNTMVTAVSPDRTVAAVNPESGVFEVKSKSVVLAMGCRERVSPALAPPESSPREWHRGSSTSMDTFLAKRSSFWARETSDSSWRDGLPSRALR